MVICRQNRDVCRFCFILFCIYIFINGFSVLSAQNRHILNLTVLAEKIHSYQNTQQILKLRLRNYDRVYERIIFYDADNRDLFFDISSKEIKKRIRGDMLNLHEGLLYEVTLVVKSAGKTGEITGELVSFKPVVLKKIP